MGFNLININDYMLASPLFLDAFFLYYAELDIYIYNITLGIAWFSRVFYMVTLRYPGNFKITNYIAFIY